MAGRLRPWKGQERFLRAAAQVAAAVPGAHFVVAGGDPFGVDAAYPRALQRLAGELGIAGRVTFTGHLDDVRPALAALDLFVHPGDPEPFGLVNVEAMAMRLPVVAFAHGALPEIVTPDAGVLVRPADVEPLAGAMSALLRDPLRRAAMGRAGRQRAETEFDIRRVAAEMEEVFAAVARASRSAARTREKRR
jgi:glycosyltransferase involved in cell wall biosynthesis